jgi:predicted ATPase
MKSAKEIGMPWYVLTGTPGSGKTAIVRQLERDGFGVVEEAATDVIALAGALGQPEPHLLPGFTDQIALLQRQRERLTGLAHPAGASTVFFDRSVVCTLALCRWLGREPSSLLTAEVDRVVRERRYERSVFFVRNQGFITPTSARRIGLADSLAFEVVHEQTYRELDFTLIEVPAGPLADRVALVCREAALLADGEATSSAAPVDQGANQCRRA